MKTGVYFLGEKMNSEVKKSLRTQGRYSSASFQRSPNENYNKFGSNQSEKRPAKRNSLSSSHRRSVNTESENENESPVKYEENSSCSFSEKMNSEVKKSFRTQGRYSSVPIEISPENCYKDKSNSNQSMKKQYKRNSGDSGHFPRSHNIKSENEYELPVKYEEKAFYTFPELEEEIPPIEIRESGKHILSETDLGISMVIYKREFFNKEVADILYEELYETINWQDLPIVIRGREYPQPRLVAWCGCWPYSYSGVTLQPAEMPHSVIFVKDSIEQYLKEVYNVTVTFNSVLMNLYRDGKDSVAWHSDDESSLGIYPTIASVSLGETRKFEMRRKYTERQPDQDEEDWKKQNALHFVNLSHGSLLIMDGVMQSDWQHQVPKEYHDKDTRINLTFRTVFPPDEPQQQKQKKPAKRNSKGDTSSKPSTYFDQSEENFPPLNPTPDLKVKYDNYETSQPCSTSKPDMNTGDYDLHKKSDFDNNLNKSNEYKHSYCKNIENEVLPCNNEMFDNSNTSNSNMSHISGESSFAEKSGNEEITRKNELNVEAAPFIPKSQPACNSYPLYLDSLNWSAYFHFDVDAMIITELLTYTSCLVSKIKREFSKFSECNQKELEFLLAISDGNQTEKNQKLITRRILGILKSHEEISNSLNANDNVSDSNSKSSKKPQKLYSDRELYKPPHRNFENSSSRTSNESHWEGSNCASKESAGSPE